MAIPAEFLFGTPLAAPAEEFHGTGHEEPSATSSQGAGSLGEVAFDIFGEPHGS
jgi:hypothetical protein